MRRDTPAEPWLSFLDDLDTEIAGVQELRCIGGFAVVQAYGLERATADIDVLAVVPGSSSSGLSPYAIGRESWHDQTLDLWIKGDEQRDETRNSVTAAGRRGHAAEG